MINTLLFIHLAISVLLIIVILLQKSSADSLSGLSGSGNMGLVSSQSAANFLTKITVILATIFFVNAIVLSNISSKSKKDILDTEDAISIEKHNKNNEKESLPISQ